MSVVNELDERQSNHDRPGLTPPRPIPNLTRRLSNAGPFSTVVVRVTCTVLGDDKVYRSIRSVWITFFLLHNPTPPQRSTVSAVSLSVRLRHPGLGANP